MQRVLGELELLEEVDGWELTVSKTRCDTNVEVEVSDRWIRSFTVIHRSGRSNTVPTVEELKAIAAAQPRPAPHPLIDEHLGRPTPARERDKPYPVGG